jgi:hypothetical protein
MVVGAGGWVVEQRGTWVKLVDAEVGPNGGQRRPPTVLAPRRRRKTTGSSWGHAEVVEWLQGRGTSSAVTLACTRASGRLDATTHWCSGNSMVWSVMVRSKISSSVWDYCRG